MYIYTGSHLTAVTDDDNDDDDNARHNSAITRETYRQQAASLMEQDNRLAHRKCKSLMKRSPRLSSVCPASGLKN